MSDHTHDTPDDEPHECVNCHLATKLTEWRDSGAPVDDVVEAIRDVVHNIVFAALDEIFEEPNDRASAH